MKVELDISDKTEGTDSPYWLIIEPRQMMRLDVHAVSAMITGPFFSREEAQQHLEARHYNFSSHAKVYCHSGYHSFQYKNAIRQARDALVSRKKEVTSIPSSHHVECQNKRCEGGDTCCSAESLYGK